MVIFHTSVRLATAAAARTGSAQGNATNATADSRRKNGWCLDPVWHVKDGEKACLLKLLETSWHFLTLLGPFDLPRLRSRPDHCFGSRVIKHLSVCTQAQPEIRPIDLGAGCWVVLHLVLSDAEPSSQPLGGSSVCYIPSDFSGIFVGLIHL